MSNMQTKSYTIYKKALMQKKAEMTEAEAVNRHMLENPHGIEARKKLSPGEIGISALGGLGGGALGYLLSKAVHRAPSKGTRLLYTLLGAAAGAGGAEYGLRNVDVRKLFPESKFTGTFADWLRVKPNLERDRAEYQRTRAEKDGNKLVGFSSEEDKTVPKYNYKETALVGGGSGLLGTIASIIHGRKTGGGIVGSALGKVDLENSVFGRIEDAVRNAASLDDASKNRLLNEFAKNPMRFRNIFSGTGVFSSDETDKLANTLKRLRFAHDMYLGTPNDSFIWRLKNYLFKGKTVNNNGTLTHMPSRWNQLKADVGNGVAGGAIAGSIGAASDYIQQQMRRGQAKAKNYDPYMDPDTDVSSGIPLPRKSGVPGPSFGGARPNITR